MGNGIELETRVFKPGDPGWSLDEAGRVENVKAGGQAEANDVRVGWQINTIDGDQYSNKILQTYSKSDRTDYTITFTTESDPELEGEVQEHEMAVGEADLHSRALRAVNSRGSNTPVPKAALEDRLTMMAFQQRVQVVQKDELRRRGKLGGIEDAEASALNPTDAESIEKRGHFQDTDVENRVWRMFHPAVFSRGVDLNTLQHALIELRRMPPQTLKAMLDLFEEKWLVHNSYLANRLKRYTGKVTDRKEQAGATYAGLVVDHSHNAPPSCEFFDRIGDEDDGYDRIAIKENDPRMKVGMRTVEVQVGAGVVAEVFDPALVGAATQENNARWGNAWEQSHESSTVLHWTRFMILLGKGLNGTGLDLHSAVLAKKGRSEPLQRSLTKEEDEVKKKSDELRRVRDHAERLHSTSEVLETYAPPENENAQPPENTQPPENGKPPESAQSWFGYW